MDESGVGRESRHVAIGALKFTKDHGLTLNRLMARRNQLEWFSELKFSEIRRSNEYKYREVAKLLAESTARFRCIVLDLEGGLDLRRYRGPTWSLAAQMTINILRASIWPNQLAAATVDYVSVPTEFNFENYVQTAVNRQLRRQGLISVSRMDSKASWGLQLADLMTGAVAHFYRQTTDGGARSSSYKGGVAATVAEQYNLDSLMAANTPKLKVFHKVAVETRNGIELRDPA